MFSPEIHPRQFGFGGGAAQLDNFRKALNVDHKGAKGITKDTKPADLFANTGACMTTPEVTEGPLCKWCHLVTLQSHR